MTVALSRNDGCSCLSSFFTGYSTGKCLKTRTIAEELENRISKSPQIKNKL